MLPDSDVEARLAGFIVRFAPEIAALVVTCRARLREHFPRGFELVFDNYNALVIGYSATGRTPDAFISIAAYPRWVTLFFLYGNALHDPAGLLEGSGTQVRGVRPHSPKDLDTPAVQQLIAQSVQPWAEAFIVAPPLATSIKLVAAKQRPRRPPEAKPKTSRGSRKKA